MMPTLEIANGSRDTGRDTPAKDHGSLRVLPDRQNIPVGIFEPCDLAAVGRGPDAEFFILGERKFFELDSALNKPLGNSADVRYFPAEDGALTRSEIANPSNSDVILAGLHYQRVLVEAHKHKAEPVHVKRPRRVVIVGDNESSQFC